MPNDKPTGKLKVELTYEQADALAGAAQIASKISSEIPEGAVGADKGLAPERLFALNQAVGKLFAAADVKSAEGLTEALKAAGIKTLPTRKAKSGVKYQCKECDNEWDGLELRPVSRAGERVSAGEMMPGGECPGCGGLCHEVGGVRTVVLSGGGQVHGVATVEGVDGKEFERLVTLAEDRYDQRLVPVDPPVRCKEPADVERWLLLRNGGE